MLKRARLPRPPIDPEIQGNGKEDSCERLRPQARQGELARRAERAAWAIRFQSEAMPGERPIIVEAHNPQLSKRSAETRST